MPATNKTSKHRNAATKKPATKKATTLQAALVEDPVLLYARGAHVEAVKARLDAQLKRRLASRFPDKKPQLLAEAREWDAAARVKEQAADHFASVAGIDRSRFEDFTRELLQSIAAATVRAKHDAREKINEQKWLIAEAETALAVLAARGIKP